MKDKLYNLLDFVEKECGDKNCKHCKFRDFDSCKTMWYINTLLAKYDVIEKGSNIQLPHKNLEIVVKTEFISDFIKQNYNLFNRDYLITVEPVDSQYMRYTFVYRFTE